MTQTDRIAGLQASVAIKAPCRAATTSAITLAGLQTVDGVALAADDRVLVKDQTDAKENGIYVAATSTWSRARDFNGARDAVQGTILAITSGTTHGGEFFRVTASDIVFGTTDIALESIGGTLVPPVPILEGGTGSTTADGALANLGGTAVGTTLFKVADAAAARSTLGLGTAAVEAVAAGGTGDLLRADGDGSALTGVTDDAVRTNVVLAMFRIAVNGGLSVQTMVDGVVDEFEDETGVDGAASSNHIYDGDGDYYHNPGTVTVTSSASRWEGATDDFTFSGDDLQGNTNDRAIRTDHTLTHDFEITFTGTTTNNSSIGVYDATEDATFNQNHGQGGLVSMTNSWWWNPGENRTTYGGTTLLTDSVANGSVVIMKRVGGTISFIDDSVTWYTFSQTFSGPVRIVAARQTGLGPDCDDFSWQYGPVSPPDMTLQSGANTAEAQPDEAFIVVWQEDVGAVTLNTDLKAYVSRDGGTTWTQIALAEEANLATGRVLTGTVDISAQPAGTSMKWRLTTHNAKELRVHGVGLEWR